MSTGPKLYKPQASDSIISEDIWNFLQSPENMEFIRGIETGHIGFSNTEYHNFITTWNTKFILNKSLQILDPEMQAAFENLSDSIQNLDSFIGKYYGVLEGLYYIPLEKSITTYPDIGEGLSWKQVLKNQNVFIDKYKEAFEAFSHIAIGQPKPTNIKSSIDINDLTSYEINFSKIRQITINNEYLLSRPNFNSENAEFFDYIFNHPKVEIDKPQLQAALKIKFKKSISGILSDLGFKGEIRKAFFPSVSKSSLIFHKSLDKDMNGVSATLFKEQLSLLKRIERK